MKAGLNARIKSDGPDMIGPEATGRNMIKIDGDAAAQTGHGEGHNTLEFF